MNNSDRTKKLNRFIKKVKADCRRHGIELNLSKGKNVVVAGLPCSGYFDAENLVLAVATGKPFSEWVEILIHEYCHLQQFLEDAQIMKDYCVDGTEAGILFDLWINHKIDLNKTQLHDVVMRVLLMEKDCEERAVEMILEEELPIDLFNYIQKANAYLFSHHAVAKHRVWFKKGHSPYKDEEVVSMMPLDFAGNYKTLGRRQLEVIADRCLDFGKAS